MDCNETAAVPADLDLRVVKDICSMFREICRAFDVVVDKEVHTTKNRESSRGLRKS